MDSYNISNNFYKKLSSKGLSQIASVSRTQDDLNLIINLSDKKDNMLDLACGYGRLTIPLAKKGYNIVGIDLSSELVNDAKRIAKNDNLKIKFDVGSMDNLPYNEETFDKIFCMWSSFNHLLKKKEQIKCINEVYRVLRNNGIAFFEMVNGEKKSIKNRLKLEGKGKDKKILVDEIDGVLNTDYMHDKKSLKEICFKSRFKNYTIKFMNLHKKRRLVMILKK
ncbi:MAG: class I SAM-dependent methyltransferase [Candidatus Woesearchaeota archaeon]